MLAQHASHGELVAHDCALAGNPSHSGVDDLEREYPEGAARRGSCSITTDPTPTAMRWRGAAIASRATAKSSRSQAPRTLEHAHEAVG